MNIEGKDILEIKSILDELCKDDNPVQNIDEIIEEIFDILLMVERGEDKDCSVDAESIEEIMLILGESM